MIYHMTIFILFSILPVFSLATPIQKTFKVDRVNNTFLKNGKPFRFVSGQFDYFRAHPESWQRKLRTMRAAGLNAITTNVEWSLHNPQENVYKWNGIADLERFLILASMEDLCVILRTGPHVDDGRDFGSLPYWLLRKYPTIKLRTMDKDFIKENKIWYAELMKIIEPYLYGNGGPVILIQVEQNYKLFNACDAAYFKWLRDEISSYTKENAVSFSYIEAGCGLNEEIITTNSNKTGPLIIYILIQEFFTSWGYKYMSKSKIEAKYIIDLLQKNANIIFDTFYGGTNFDFTSGAHTDRNGNNYISYLTSYDYDLPMNEAGDPTEKYFKLRDIIGYYLPLPNITIPRLAPKINYGIVKLLPQFSILSNIGRQISKGTVFSENPLSFEELDQNSGLILYETKLPESKNDMVKLNVERIHDRAYIYVNNHFIGILSRSLNFTEISILSNAESTLQILVENQGRIAYDNAPLDFKGILGNVYYDNKILTNWSMTKYPFDNYRKISEIIKENKENKYEDHLDHLNCMGEQLQEINNIILYERKNDITFDKKYDVNNMIKNFLYHTIIKNLPISLKINIEIEKNKEKQINLNTILDENFQIFKENILRHGPVIFYGELIINENNIGDTYLDTTGWGKGFIFINGFNLGRYWPTVGPQITLYVPREILKSGVNEIILIEYQMVSSQNIKFTAVPIIKFHQ